MIWHVQKDSAWSEGSLPGSGPPPPPPRRPQLLAQKGFGPTLKLASGNEKPKGPTIGLESSPQKEVSPFLVKLHSWLARSALPLINKTVSVYTHNAHSGSRLAVKARASLLVEIVTQTLVILWWGFWTIFSNSVSSLTIYAGFWEVKQGAAEKPEARRKESC